MKIRRRDFLKGSGAAVLSGGFLRSVRATDNPSIYDVERVGFFTPTMQQVDELGCAQPPGVGDEQRDEDARGHRGEPGHDQYRRELLDEFGQAFVWNLHGSKNTAFGTFTNF